MRKQLLVTVIVLFTLPMFAQTSENPTPRKKIGLVLEGGGALGLAHVGVIEWLEENHIPVDYIAGTSMGGLIGGMYAMGYSPKEIRDTVALIDWDAVLYDRIDYGDLPFRRKQDRRTYPNTLAFGLRKGFRLPEGFNAGHRVGLILDNITRDYSSLQNFDDLPTPFRCVGVDMTTGTKDVFGSKHVAEKETVLAEGPLSQALRSTMSLPGFFSPVRGGGKELYIDGGILDNLPVEVVQNMGAEIVIAVHLDKGSFDPAKDISLLDVVFRTITVMVSSNENASLARLKKDKDDFEVDVPLQDFKSSDYEKRDKLREQGRLAAEANLKKLLALQLSPQDWQSYQQARDQKDLRKRKDLPEKPAVQEIAVTNPLLQKEISHGVSDYKGKPFEEKQVGRLEGELNRIAAAGRFERLGFRLVDHNGQPDLVITAAERASAVDVIPVLAIDGSDYRSPIFTLGARVTLFDVGGIGSEWRSDALLGSQYGLTSEYYHPLRAFGNWFVAPQVTAETLPFDIYSRLTPIADYELRTISGTLDLGYNFNRDAQVRVGYEGGAVKLSETIGKPLFPFSSSRIGTTSLKFSLDKLKFTLHKLEAPVAPRDGMDLNSKFQWHDSWLGSTHRFPTADADLGLFKSVNPAGSIYLKASAGSTLGFTNDGLPSFNLGSPLRLAAYGTNELLANQFLYARAGYVHRVYVSESLFGGGIYVTGSYELGKTYGLAGAPSLPMDATAGIILDYAVGPIFLGGSMGESGHKKLFFYLGKLF
ncbi:MAG TPA: patatin-like phospholipase family protein [Candidatus Angelobacter sp.]